MNVIHQDQGHSQGVKSLIRTNCHGRINHSAPHTNVRRGPFSHARSQDFLWRCTSPPQKKKVDDLILVAVVTFKPTLNVQTSKQRVKNLAADRGAPWRRGPLPWYNRHCRTMDNPALPTASYAITRPNISCVSSSQATGTILYSNLHLPSMTR